MIDMSYANILECYLIESDIATEGATLDAYKTQFHGQYRIYRSAVREGKKLEKAGQYEDAHKKYISAANELSAMAKELKSPIDDTIVSNAIGFVIPIVLAIGSWLAFGKVLRIVGGAVAETGYKAGKATLAKYGNSLYNTGANRTNPNMIGLVSAMTVLINAIQVYFSGGGTSKNPQTYNSVRIAASTVLQNSADVLRYKASVIRNRKNKVKAE